MSLQVGQLLEGRYLVTKTIQAGGMGALYEAQDTRLADSPCAVKVMLPHEGESRDYIQQRFLEEMKVLSRLNHPGIPRVRDFFSKEGTNYIVMDLVAGRNLADVLRARLTRTEKPMDGDEVIQIALQVLEVLDYLHSHKPPIVHRDIKPANLIEEQGCRIKLVDFGIACDQTDLTRTQVGTVGSCPLEQMQGKANTSSDIYALGATMHHLLTGVAPLPLHFESLARSRPDLAAPLMQAVHRAIAQKSEDRFQTAAQFATALRGALGSSQRLNLPTDEEPTCLVTPPATPMTEAPTTRPLANPWLLPALTTGVVLVLGTGMLFGSRSRQEAVESSPTPSTVVHTVATPSPSLLHLQATPLAQAQATPPPVQVQATVAPQSTPPPIRPRETPAQPLPSQPAVQAHLPETHYPQAKRPNLGDDSYPHPPDRPASMLKTPRPGPTPEPTQPPPVAAAPSPPGPPAGPGPGRPGQTPMKTTADQRPWPTYSDGVPIPDRGDGTPAAPPMSDDPHDPKLGTAGPGGLRRTPNPFGY